MRNPNATETDSPDFEIKPKGVISTGFLQRDISSFREAADYVQNLPYGRNPDKMDLATLFTDQCGTCSTKHALLRQLAIEQGFEEIRLILGMIKMSAGNTPQIAGTLNKHQLQYIPEAHNYLKFRDRIYDYTRPGFSLTANKEDMLAEIEISPAQITGFKVNFHKNYLASWLHENPEITWSAAELWHIREQCIQDLSDTNP